MTSLSQNEEIALKALKDGKEKGVPAICKETGLNEDGARRGVFFLSQKGLASMRVEESNGIKVTEKGKAALHSFPDLKLLDYGGNVLHCLLGNRAKLPRGNELAFGF